VGARRARKESQIDGTMFSREYRKTQAFVGDIVPRLFHRTGADAVSAGDLLIASR